VKMLSFLVPCLMTTACMAAHSPPVPASPSGFTETEVTFANGSIALVGTLRLPAGEGPHAVAVLLSGSGPQDRDGATSGFIPGYEPSRALADRLSQQGIGSFRYDERGVGSSTGDHSVATPHDLASDAAAAITHLRTVEEVDPDRIGLIGHSEGSMLAAMVAARDPRTAFVVSLAGPGVTGYDLLGRQNERVFTAAGMDPESVERMVTQARHAMDLTLAEDWEALDELLWKTGRAELAAMPEEQRATLGDPEAYLAAHLPDVLRRYQTWMRAFLIHDPADDWARVQAPVLAVFGQLDTQVDPDQNRAPLEAAVRAGGNRDVTSVVIPGANHTFQPGAVTGSPMEYAELGTELMPEMLDLVASWVAARLLQLPRSGQALLGPGHDQCVGFLEGGVGVGDGLDAVGQHVVHRHNGDAAPARQLELPQRAPHPFLRDGHLLQVEVGAE